jgi:hypothetical protein
MKFRWENAQRLDRLTTKTDLIGCTGLAQGHLEDFLAGEFAELMKRIEQRPVEVTYINVLSMQRFQKTNTPIGLVGVSRDGLHAVFSVCPGTDGWGIVSRTHFDIPLPLHDNRRRIQDVISTYNHTVRPPAVSKNLRSTVPLNLKRGPRFPQLHGMRTSSVFR